MDTYCLLNELQSKSSFREEDFPAFLDLFEPLTIRKRDYLYRQGEIVRYACFVLKGCLRHYYANSEGIERTVLFAEENWWVGDLVSFLERKPTNLNLQATEDCDLLIIERNQFDHALKEFPGFLEYYQKGTQRTYTKLQERVGQSLSDSAIARYRRLEKERPGLLLRLSQHDIASYLGIAPESLSRLRRMIGHPKEISKQEIS